MKWLADFYYPDRMVFALQVNKPKPKAEHFNRGPSRNKARKSYMVCNWYVELSTALLDLEIVCMSTLPKFARKPEY